MERCDTPDYFANEDCVKDAYKHANIDMDVIDRCIKDSGGLEKNQANTFLDLEIRAKDQLGVVIIPTAFVNNIALHGGLSVDTVFTAICSGYLEGTEPKVCKKCKGCSDFDACIATDKCKTKGGGGVSARMFTSSILLVFLAFGGAAFWHYRRTREEMRNRVRDILAEYMPLEGDDGEVGSPIDLAERVVGTENIET